MLRVTRYDQDGKVFHTCLSSTAALDTNEHGKVCIDMPMRYWRMVDGGRIEISVSE
jgi:hypothetical protein